MTQRLSIEDAQTLYADTHSVIVGNDGYAESVTLQVCLRSAENGGGADIYVDEPGAPDQNIAYLELDAAGLAKLRRILGTI